MNIMLLLTTAVTSQLPEANLSLWSLIVKGGWLMIPIFLLSIVGIYIICERISVLRKLSKTPKDFTEKIIHYMETGNSAAALQECKAEDSPLARILQKGIRYSHIPVPELRNSLENTASSEVAGLEKGLSLLATVAGIAPMIGFLGTVVGMVQAFYDMSLAGNNINITLLSRGIYTAMITTVAGLIVGIIAYFGYSLLVGRIEKTTDDWENSISAFLDSLYAVKK